VDTPAPAPFDDTKRTLVLEQYKIYVDLMDRMSARRLSTNEFFLAVNTALITLLGAAVVGFEHLQVAWVFFVAIAGLTLCFCWYRMVRSYKQLNTVKFKVIRELEAHLPFALFDMEWELLGKGKVPKTYLPFTSVEGKIPWVFAGLYFVLTLWSTLQAVAQAQS
jgi:hypothetical protein